MGVRRLITGSVISCAVIFILLAVTGTAMHAQTGSGSGNYDILSKLDEVLKGQRAIIDDLAAIKEELRIIKIRVTQTQ